MNALNNLLLPLEIDEDRLQKKHYKARLSFFFFLLFLIVHT